jgi:hypothetical protein
MSILDGFLGYNQVLVTEEDRQKNYFVTPWVTFTYVLMPFGIKHDDATFHRAMDYVFNDLTKNSLQITKMI